MSTEETAQRNARISGTLVNVAGQVFNQVVRLFANLIVTRLLFPEAYGVMAVVNAVIIGLEMVSDLGIIPSIIQNDRDDEAFLDTAWTLSVVRGAILFVGGCAIGFGFAYFYDEPRYAALIPVASLTPLVYGALPTKLHVCLRERRLVSWTLVMVLARVIAVAGMIALAYVYRSIWPLVIAAVGEHVVQLVLASVLIKGRMNRFRWDRAAVSELFHFGKWIFVSTLVTFLGTKFDILSLPKLSDFDTTGVYSIAVVFGRFPLEVGNQVINSVLLPALSESRRESHEKLQAAFHDARKLMLPIHLFVTLGLVLGGPVFFELYDERWSAATWIVQVFMVTVWFEYLIEAWGRALLALGNARPLVAVNAVRLIGTAVGCLVGYELFGLVGFILGTAFGTVLGYVVIHISLRQHSLPALRLDLKYLGLVAVIGLGGGFAPYLIVQATTLTEVVWVQLGLGVAILAPMGLWVLRFLREVIRQRRAG